jgi:hypothetical protein
MARQNFKDMQITHMGRTQSFKQWVEELGCNYMLVVNRYRNGHRRPEALFAPAGSISTPPEPNTSALAMLVGNRMAEMIEGRAQGMGLTPQEMTRYLLAKALAE